MKKTEQSLFHSEQVVPLLGHHLIRNVLMSDMLGKDRDSVLYWSGKRLARQYLQTNIDEIINFFVQVGWGKLTIIKEKKDELTFQLVSPFHQEKITVTHQLEAGFLAEQLELQLKLVTEAVVQEKKDKAIITLKWDTKDRIE